MPAKPRRSRSVATACSWVLPCSSSSHPPRVKCRGAAAMMASSASSPAGPATSASAGSALSAASAGSCVRDVRRIGDDDVEDFAGYGVEPGSQSKGHVRQREGARIVAGDTQGRRRHVDTHDACERPLGGDGERHRAAAGAEIEHARGSPDCGKCCKAISTSSSVSGRGTSTAGVTLSGSDQNSRRPVR